MACFVLTACGDPIADIPLLSEQDLPDDSSTAEVVAQPMPEGTSLLERLLGDVATEPATPSRTLAAVPADVPSTDTEPAATEPTSDTAKSGLLAMLTRAATPKQDVVPADAKAKATKVSLTKGEAAQQSDPSVLPATPKPELAVEPTKRNGLFAGMTTKPGASTPVSEITLGTVLPYGKVARICGLSKRELGKKIAQHPEKRPKHRIYDSKPGTIAPHSFFITGFDDGCARQFTASLAMFGSVAMHEQLRYGLPSKVQPYSDTDKAYEKLKSRVCGVPRKKPCGAKVSKLDGSTVFVSIYERFGSNPVWTNLLLHNGDVLAQDRKGI